MDSQHCGLCLLIGRAGCSETKRLLWVFFNVMREYRVNSKILRLTEARC